jgi:hypothetical protein
MFLLTIPLYAVSLPKIHVFLDFSTLNNSFAKEMERGLRIGFEGVTDTTSFPSTTYLTADASSPTVTSYSILSGGATVIVSHIPRADANFYATKYKEAAEHADTLAIVVSTSSQASNSGSTWATNVLTISPTATSSTLLSTTEYPGMLLVSPPNGLQARAIFQSLKDNGVKKFVVVYEPEFYGIDLYSTLMAEFASETYKDPTNTPVLLSALPLHDIRFAGDSAYQTVLATRAIAVIRQLVIDNQLDTTTDAIVYCGGRLGFQQLAQAEKAQVSGTSIGTGLTRWYGGDELYDTPPYEKLGLARDDAIRLQVVMMGVPSETINQANKNTFESLYGARYIGQSGNLYTYLAFDTAKYLSRLMIATRGITGSLTKANVLTYAKGTAGQPIKANETEDGLVTGDKGFGVQGQKGSFTSFNLDVSGVEGVWSEGATKAIDSAE